ncbi:MULTISPECIES: helix-turn-helix transcriptional regulator [Pseudomonas]|jgi:predicted DNA-binding transcriptional regulator YafY|uniref:WYL domain-containing protein n=1 Tax=Pseudomonas juntendi TaxID=2666183 RepID=A0A7W2LPH0_9PSED|nr:MULTISPECIES: WYL domain-containing protein [Pseudomonas]NOY04113.1 WYL domain-containing protein [Gammaproteobacteria bacterium]PPB13724.1 WYL domain-containing protein [Pseudomonas aeruginosa]KGK27585.1 transcriptional regulator [Pseudomonas plecoglossicida]MBA6144661.1 WYL domain-containing protein [Pseudomonas juntendi]MCL8328867.1 WYL domain-containing protein [Pseudomonas juntendi]
MKHKQSMDQIRWDLALRYRLIETVVWWEGRLTTNHLMQCFGISRQQASKDINTYITDYASKNLVYDKQIKGYVPTQQFKPLFIDDSASAYLDLLNHNDERAPHIEGLNLAYAHTEVLKVPDRSVRPEVLRPLLKACREKRRLDIEYVSFKTPEVEGRTIAPHTLVYTGMRWHVRAYCEKNREYRDFVLSRFRGEPELLDDQTENGVEHDVEWNTKIDVIFKPDERLTPAQRSIIEVDYAMTDGQLVVKSSQALAKYVVKRFHVNPNLHDARPEAQQLVLANRAELKLWLSLD